MNDCPCCSGKAFGDCCSPYLGGKAAPSTAEALMRARYTAYSKADLDFIYESSGPAVRKDFDMESTRKWAETAKWNGLEVLKTTAGGPDDTQGTVEFVARYEVGEQTCNHHEVAEFTKLDGQWKFIDGQVIGPEPIRREEPRIGRNDPCPCGSGKKFKKCCAGRK